MLFGRPRPRGVVERRERQEFLPRDGAEPQPLVSSVERQPRDAGTPAASLRRGERGGGTAPTAAASKPSARKGGKAQIDRSKPNLGTLGGGSSASALSFTKIVRSQSSTVRFVK